MNRKLFYFLSGITAFRIVYAVFLPISAQEAYYWNYSRHPALSYFDHPPLAAYLIKLTTLFGTSNFTVHLAAIILSVLLSLAIYRLAQLMFDSAVAFWSVVAVNITFIFALGSIIITPDNPMILFWVLGMIVCYRIAEGGGILWWILLGICLGAGFDGKYTMAFAWLGVLIYFIVSKERLRHFTAPGPYIALIVTFIVTLPVIYWNYEHHWASFLFQSERRAGEMNRFRPDFFFGYLGTIMGIYGIIPIPLLFVGMVDAIKRAFKEKTAEYVLLASFSLPLVLFLIFVSARSWVKMNWTAPAFIGWFIAATAYYFRNRRIKKWIDFWGKFSLIFLAATFIAVHIMVLIPGVYIGKEDYSVGWKQLAARVESIREQMPEPYFICGYEYKTASLLAFYLPGRPETVSNNIVGRPGLQYDYWADPDTLVGYNAIFVYDDRVKYQTPGELDRLFVSVIPEEIVPVKKGGKSVTNFHIFRCYDYRGLKEGE